MSTSWGLWWAAARWPATARQLGLSARLQLARCSTTRDGVRLALKLEHGQTADDLASAADRIRSCYACSRVDVSADFGQGNLVTVVLRWSPRPPCEPYAFLPEPSRIIPPRASDPVPLGLDLDGGVVGFELFHPVVGGSSLLIGGVPGSGKTTALRVVLAGLARTTACIVVIDPTGGAEATNWMPRLGAAVLDAEPSPTAVLLQRVLRIIERRGHLVAAGARPPDLPPLVIVCDELAELGAAGTSKQQEEVRSLLRRVVSLGRKANVACVFATQRTTASSIDVTTRSLVAWRLALAHPGDRYGSEAVLGPGRYDAAELPKSARGLGYLTDGGPPQLLQVFSLDTVEIPDLLHEGLGRDLDELEAWDEVLAHELTS